MKNTIFRIILLFSSIFTGYSQEIIHSRYIPPYALPVTRIQIKVVEEKTYLFKGLYKDYAQKYLGINDVIEKDDSLYNFEILKISTLNEPDVTTFVPSFQKANKNIVKIFNLLKHHGYILVPNSNENIKYANIKNITSLNYNPIDKSLSVKRNIIKEKQIKEKKIKKDTTFITIPEEHELLKTKDIETKAEEAANFIIKIRKRLFKTITGQENTPQGEAMHHAINTLKDLEKQYLSLFTGTKITTYDTLDFEIVIDEDNINKPLHLFYFSSQRGITNQKFENSTPIYLHIKDLYNNYTNQEFILKKNKIKYRLPEKVTLVINNGINEIFQTEIFVFISRK